MSFSVFTTGGKQYLVREGDTLKIEKLSGSWKKDELVVFDKVLLFDDGTETKIGTPYLSGANLKAVIIDIGRGRKVEVVKYKAKSRYFKLRGHRQPYMKVRIAALG